jgi:hypothetical protein
LDITNEGVIVTVVAPTQIINEPTPMVVDTPTATPEVPTSLESGYPGIPGWLVMILIVSGISWLAFTLGEHFYSSRWGIRWVLCILLGGLSGYNYLVLGFTGGRNWIQSSGLSAVAEMVILSTLAGWVCGWFWTRLSMKQRSDQANQE